MKKQAGFTLIELVMVIVILGILSAVALPKFVNLGSDARTAAMKALEGSMRSTNAIIYAKASVGNTMGSGATTTVNGVSITTNFGFAKTVADLVNVMDIGTDFDATTVTTEIEHKGAGTPGSCKVAYAAATSATTPPTYTLTSTGC